MEDRTNNVQSKIASSLLWKFLEQFGQQFVAIIVSMVLARLLDSKEYEPVTLINAFIAIASVFVTSGLSTALIQKPHVDEEDFSSAFFLCFGVATVAYIALFFTAPFVAGFYGIPQITPMMRVMTLTLFLGAINSMQNAVISRNMQFKKYFFSSLAGVFTSGTVGITMAYMGFGTWSLVASNLGGTFAITTVLWFTVDWRPSLKFNAQKAKVIFSYGSKLLISGLLDSVFNNIYPMIISKMQSMNPGIAGQNESLTAYYDKGKSQPNLIVNNINNAIQGVMFPAFSAVQSDKKELKNLAKRTIVTSSFLIFPIAVGLAAVARPLIILMYTESWAGSVPFMQLTCFMLMFYPIHTCNLQLMNAMGRPDWFLKLEIIKKILWVIILVVTVPMGVYPMVVGSVVNSVICIFINAWPNKQLMNYGPFEQIKDVVPNFLLTMVIGAAAMSVQLLNLNNFYTLILQMAVGGTVYLAGAFIFKFESLSYAINLVKKSK